MVNRRFARAVLLALAVSSATISAQNFAPGYLDPQPVLKAASDAIGADRVKCVSMTGTGYSGMVGQARMNGYDVDWPRGAPLANYTRTMNWDTRTMKEEFDRPPGKNPASWKYGLGWAGGAPLQKNSRQTFVVNGTQAWYQDGAGTAPVAVPPRDAERWQLDMWVTPHGFLKAAAMPGANPKAVWRWELGEMGRDGATTTPEKMTVVSITVMGKYRVDATINKEHMLQRIHTWVPDPVLGDTNYEHEFTNDSYADAGGGVRFPTVWHHHEGWDDNYQAQSVNAGHNAFGGTFKEVRANQCGDAIAVPEAVRQATFPIRVDTQRLANGVYMLGGASHNSIAVEFKDYVAVVEAPLDEARNLAVIEEVVKLVPNKPIRFLVNTHQHFDHLGGLRTYMHIGATIITHWKNYEFYTHDVLELRAAHADARHDGALAADRGGGRLPVRIDPRELHADRRRADDAHLVRAAAAARGRDADGVPAGREDRDRSGPLRSAQPADAGDDDLRQPRPPPRPRRADDRPDPRSGHAVARSR